MKETAEERIIKTKIKIAYSNPFFAYLSLYLTIEEDKIGRIPNNCGMGVNPKGYLYYRKEFVDEITDEELLGVLAHEILHLSLLHLVRMDKKNRLRWNIATDVITNTILIQNGYKLPKGLRPNAKNEFICLGTVIKNVDSKSAEEVYDELPNIPEQKSNIYITFDNHERGENKEGEQIELTDSELQKIETEWLNRVQTAMVMSQQRGKLPKGLERYVDDLKKTEINWKVILRKFIQQTIPTDYSWIRPNKKSQAVGCYLPSTKKEKINIVVGIDTSGSIEKEDLIKFLSEIIGIAKTYKEVIDMRILFHDIEIHGDYVVKNGSIPQIMAMKPRGGGGTSHQELLDMIKKNIRDCKCLVSFTDGYSDIEEIKLNDYKFPKLFIINKKGMIPKIKKGDAMFIKLKDN